LNRLNITKRIVVEHFPAGINITQEQEEIIEETMKEVYPPFFFLQIPHFLSDF